MTRAYVDASAILKLIHATPESQALKEYVSALTEACTSVLSEVELSRAARRLGFSANEARVALDAFFVIGLDSGIRARAATLLPLALRTADAIHLATALELGAALLPFVTYDERLADAARAHGFTVVRPE
jgi:predicted nucleic acid-binding protein